MTKSERLLREIRARGGMTYTEIQQFILDMDMGFGNVDYDYTTHGNLWGSTLNGKREREGLLERFCEKRGDKFQVVRSVKGPFTPQRRFF